MRWAAYPTAKPDGIGGGGSTAAAWHARHSPGQVCRPPHQQVLVEGIDWQSEPAELRSPPSTELEVPVTLVQLTTDDGAGEAGRSIGRTRVTPISTEDRVGSNAVSARWRAVGEAADGGSAADRVRASTADTLGHIVKPERGRVVAARLVIRPADNLPVPGPAVICSDDQIV